MESVSTHRAVSSPQSTSPCPASQSRAPKSCRIFVSHAHIFSLSLSASGIPQRHIIPRSVLSTLCRSPIRLLFELNHVPAPPPSSHRYGSHYALQQHDEGSTTKHLSTYPPCFLAPTLVQACLPNRPTEQDERCPELHFDFLLEGTTLGREGFVLLYRWIRKRSRIMARMKAAWGQRLDIVCKVQRTVGGVGSYLTVRLDELESTARARARANAFRIEAREGALSKTLLVGLNLEKFGVK